MKKIPTVLVRNPDDRAHVLDVLTPGCEWITDDGVQPTRKYDGTCVMAEHTGVWWARREVKPGKDYPENFWVQDEDPVTGKTQGWEPIEQSPFVKFWQEAIERFVWPSGELAGTYELIGPKVNGNPEGLERHELQSHARAEVAPIWAYLTGNPVEVAKETVRTAAQRGWEGIVWHHPDGRMAKLKVRDFA